MDVITQIASDHSGYKEGNILHLFYVNAHIVVSNTLAFIDREIMLISRV